LKEETVRPAVIYATPSGSGMLDYPIHFTFINSFYFLVLNSKLLVYVW